VRHALLVRQASLQDNYHTFFKLYRETPNLGSCIIDLMLDAWRFKALQRMIKSYKPNIDVSFVTSELSFESTEECVEFLASVGKLVDVIVYTLPLYWHFFNC
jgi:SAC3 family protein LENG8/THP3